MNGTPAVSDVNLIVAPIAVAVTGTSDGILLFINCDRPLAMELLFSATPALNTDPFTKYSNWIPFILTLTLSSILKVPDTVSRSICAWLLFCPPDIAETMSAGTSNLPSSEL